MISHKGTAHLNSRLRTEREWHDQHFDKKHEQKGQRWFGTRLRAWFYSDETARSADQYMSLLMKRVKPHQRVLDYGCGLEGRLWVALADTKAQVYAFDISSTAMQQVSQSPEASKRNVSFFTSAAEQLPCSDHQFDVVIGESVLHHLDLRTALPELWRILKPGAIGIFREPLQGNFFLRLFRRITPKDRTTTEKPFDTHDFELIQQWFDIEHRQNFFLLTPFTIIIAVFSQSIATKVWKLLEVLDRRLIHIFPFLGEWCWQTVVVLRRKS